LIPGITSLRIYGEKLGMVVQTHNPSYPGSRDQGDFGSRPAQVKKKC
jgi:hypothetical protein